MVNLLGLLALLTVAPAVPEPAPPAPAAAVAEFAGHWEGAVIRTLGRDEVDFTLDLEPPAKEGGDWTGKMSNLLTGMRNRPMTRVSIAGAEITIEEVMENGRRLFQGKLNEDGRVVGEYTRDGKSLPFEMERRPSYRPFAESELTDLAPDAKELKQAFDRDKDKIRMIILLSPTCTTCAMGSRVIQRYALDQIPDDRLRFYVVWLPYHPLDLRIRAQEATVLFNDPRVRQFWAADMGLPEAYKTLFKKDFPVWDVFLTYPAGATWTEPAPAPGHLMHNMAALPDDQRLDGLLLGKELTRMLAQ